MLDIITDIKTLHKKSVPVEFGTDLSLIIQDMKKTMKYYNGVGLSAPQINIHQRFFIMNPSIFNFDSNIITVINPEIDYYSTNTDRLEEGCLSFPDKYKMVSRNKMIHVKYYDENWKEHSKYLRNISARIFLHEFDHLNGKTIF